MTDGVERSVAAPRHVAASRREGWLRTGWRRFRRTLVQSGLFKHALASLLVAVMRLVRWTNPLRFTDLDLDEAYAKYTPAIAALWHGQHLLIPFYYLRGKPLVIMVSRSADAEMNALVIEKIGMEAVRGSGGRDQSRHLEKGGARALIALKKALEAGKNVAMIADIPHGTPRDAGLGIILLARLSGRPIVPLALATSRRRVIDRSWDKTTISLPFGRAVLAIGEPVSVPSDAGDALMEEKRRELTASLNAATERAYAMADRRA
jgi:lysophospholipid acyltransferase (LPLAT)-like uncharacterized protein